MNDQQMISAVVAAIEAEHGNHATVKSALEGNVFQDILTKLRALKIPWLKIFQALPTIVALVFSGASVQAIIAAVLAIFAQPAP